MKQYYSVLLKILKTRLAMLQVSLLPLTLVGQGVGLGDLQRCQAAPMIL